MSVLRLGLGLGLPQNGSNVNLSPEVKAYISGLTTAIPTEQVLRLDTRVKSMKTRLGVSALSEILDVFYFLGNHTQEAALRNIVKDAHHATTSGITFEQYKGLKGNKTSHFVDTNYNPSTATNYKQDDACIGGYTYVQDTDTIGNACVYWGVENTTNYIRFIPHRDSGIFININEPLSTTIQAIYSSPDRALHLQNRVSDSDVKLYKNGQLYYTYVNNSNGIPNGNVYLFARNAIGTGASLFTDAGLSCWFAGKGLTESQIEIINDEIEQYMVSISNNYMVKITTPTVIFNFDDGNAEHATLTKSIFDAYGKKCTHFIVSDNIGQAGFMTVENLQALYAAGYDLQCHSKDHSNLSTLTEAQLITQFETVDAFFTTNNLPIPKHHAYPGGTHNSGVLLNLIYKYRQSARGIGNTNIYYSGYVMPEYRIKTARSIDAQTVALIMNNAIDIAKANNGVVIFYGHGVYENDSSESAYPNPVKAQALRDAIAYAISQGVEVKTYSEVFDRDNWY